MSRVTSRSYIGTRTLLTSGLAENHARRSSVRHQLAVLVQDLALCGRGAPAHVNDAAVGCQLVTVERHSADVVELEFEGRVADAAGSIVCTAQPMTESSSVAQMPP